VTNIASVNWKLCAAKRGKKKRNNDAYIPAFFPNKEDPSIYVYTSDVEDAAYTKRLPIVIDGLNSVNNIAVSSNIKGGLYPMKLVNGFKLLLNILSTPS